MDSITQAALGAALGGAVLGRSLGRSALLGGAVLGILPDLDSFLEYGDAVSNFTQHRGFSHSFLILVPMALVLARLLKHWRPAIPTHQWALFTGLILLTHPLLDAFTTYGTQLFWPFAGPVSFTSIFIIDPLYTLPLLVGCGIALWRPPALKPLGIGLALSTAYLGWSLAGQHLITKRVMPALAAHGLEDAPRLVQPMPFSTLLWRVTVMGESDRYEIVAGFWDRKTPPRMETYPRNRVLQTVTRTLPQGERLIGFTDGFLSYEDASGILVATDVRLGFPGFYPFSFALAYKAQGQWQPVESYLMPRPNVDLKLLPTLLRRTLGHTTGTDVQRDIR